ncbi:MAG: hypothetical protein AAGA92_14010 [Planctomycetota bacterium]
MPLEMVTAEQLRLRIEAEIGGDWSCTNGHGCDLRQCLFEPEKQLFEDSDNPLWLLLEEDPVSRDGYKVVYDESTGMFGLACRFMSGRNGYLGPYGDTFLEAFKAM